METLPRYLKGNLTMYRKFISIVVAASVAVTGLTAAPARAEINDTTKIIAGVAALAIIGAAIADNKKDKRRRDRDAAARNNNYYSHEQYRYDRSRKAHRYNDHDHHHKKHHRDQRHRKGHHHDVWGQNNGRRNGQVFGHNGQRRAERRALPAKCLRQGSNGQTFYSQRCLSRNGMQTFPGRR
ncbi:hypothetical protein PEL8287_03094 [Roseovarius litorisediminis]|uniref:Uncharacterized protein n=2 Tax=Roseovarius litorisediminis TaxID=1312363 RepID=A0A1Y5T857_9RHOB|nr:hypothetical protein PEL8287_03094 [Roseovarius litorisediminis]